MSSDTPRLAEYTLILRTALDCGACVALKSQGRWASIKTALEQAGLNVIEIEVAKRADRIQPGLWPLDLYPYLADYWFPLILLVKTVIWNRAMQSKSVAVPLSIAVMNLPVGGGPNTTPVSKFSMSAQGIQDWIASLQPPAPTPSTRIIEAPAVAQERTEPRSVCSRKYIPRDSVKSA